MLKPRFVFTLIVLAIAIFIANAVKPVAYTPIYSGDGWEIDVVCEVYKIVDGDTFDCFPVGRVRLADINAPELSTYEGVVAKQALANLVSRYGPKVYLHVDDWYVMDSYNRVVVVAYLRYNKTHLLNVNKWLLDNGYAVIMDYPNEFNPYTWALYVYYPVELENQKAFTEIKTATTTTTITSYNTITKTTTDTVTKTETIYNTITIYNTVTETVTKTQTVTTTVLSTTTSTVIITKTTTFNATSLSTKIDSDAAKDAFTTTIAQNQSNATNSYETSKETITQSTKETKTIVNGNIAPIAIGVMFFVAAIAYLMLSRFNLLDSTHFL